ncbi:MAG: hypothetical protein ACNYZI_09700 [Anaerolineales bacterium]
MRMKPTTLSSLLLLPDFVSEAFQIKFGYTAKVAWRLMRGPLASHNSMNSRLFLAPLVLSTFIVACKPSSPMELGLDVVGEPIVGRVVDLVVTIESSEDAPQTRVKVSIPEEIRVIEGVKEFDVSLSKNIRFEQVIKIQVMQAGEFPIAAYGFYRYSEEDLNGFGDGQTIYIISDKNSAEVSSREDVVTQNHVGPCVNCSTPTVDPVDVEE